MAQFDVYENTNEKTKSNIPYLLDIQKGEDKFALILLLMVSFIYGVIHSIGPGHGKALAFSYFSSQKSSFFEAFVISLVTAFIHILGALFIVLFCSKASSSFPNDDIILDKKLFTSFLASLKFLI